MKIRISFSIYFTLSMLVTAIFTTTFIIIYNQLDWYDLLISQKFMMIPIGVFIVLVIILVSLFLSWTLSIFLLYPRKQIIEQLEKLENGEYQLIDTTRVEHDEYYGVWTRLNDVTRKMKNQAATYQKLVSERVEWDHEKREEILKEERNRLARELHDSVSQQLFAATMLLSALNQQYKNENHAENKQMKLLENIILEAQSEMRALLLHLRPVQLEGKSLKLGIEEMLTELTAKLSIKVIWNIQDLQLEKGVEDHLFRIIQEAVSNTLRHAKANVVEINLKKINEMIYLKISDDGKGFHLSEQKTGSYGMSNMKERAEAIGGVFKLISVIDQGSSVEVKIPYVIEGERQ